MADIITGEEELSQMAPGGFSLTDAQKDELRKRVGDLLASFESDRNLIERFLQSPFDYLEQNHPISFLAEMNTKKPDLVFSFDRAIRRLKLELFEARGNCLACILSALALIYGYLLHYGLSVELLKSVVVEIVLGLADFFKVNDQVRGFLEVIGGLSISVAPLSLARRFCRIVGLCKKVVTSIDLDTIGSSIIEKEKSQPRKEVESGKKGQSFDL